MAFLEAQCLKESFKAEEHFKASGTPPEISARIPLEGNFPSVLKRGRSNQKRNTWISALISSVCGFAAAFCLTGYWDEVRNVEETGIVQDGPPAFSVSENEPEKAFSNEELTQDEDVSGLALFGSAGGKSAANQVNRFNAGVPAGTPAVKAAPLRCGLSKSVMKSFPAESDQTEIAAEERISDSGVKHIILRRSDESDGISIPCVAVDSYSSDSKTADALAEGLRKNGCGVETLHEELKFPLKDGKTLIVPVDTINVRRPSDVHFL